MRSISVTMRSSQRVVANACAVIRNSRHNIQVELTTPRGRVFAGKAASAEFSFATGVVQMEPGGADYLGWIESGEISLRIGNEFRFFMLLRASASIEARRLTVIAEVIQPTIAPVRNCANAACICESLDAQETKRPRVRAAGPEPRRRRRPRG